MRKVVLFKNNLGKYCIVLRDKHKIRNLYGIFDISSKKIILNKHVLYNDLFKGIFFSSTVSNILRKYTNKISLKAF